MVHVPQYEDNPFVQDIQQCLNEDKTRLETLVSQLRFWVRLNDLGIQIRGRS